LRCLELRQRRADIRENGVDCGGYVADTRDAHKRNQGDQQSVFNQILTFFAVLQALEFHIHFQQCVFHLCFSMGEFRPEPGAIQFNGIFMPKKWNIEQPNEEPILPRQD
jgi:hypothetical protein